MRLPRAAMRLPPVLLLLALAGCVSTNKPPVGRTPAAAATYNVQLSIEYMRLGKLETAREFIERALKEDPNSASVEATAGLVYERMGDLGKAEHAFGVAVRVAKDDPNILNNYAGFLCRNKQTVQGEKMFLQVVRNPLYTTPEVALVNAGVCVHSAGDNISAERYFREALTVRPNMPEAFIQLGNLLLERDDPSQALVYVLRDLQLNAPSADALWLGFRSERKLGDADAAAAYAKRLQTEFPASDQARMLDAGVVQ